jgi:hypothetical protein
MMVATSYGLIALCVILAFYVVWGDEKPALPANCSPSLVDDRKMNPLREVGTAAVNRSRTESAGREGLAESVLSVQMTPPDANSPLRDWGPAGVSHG